MLSRSFSSKAIKGKMKDVIKGEDRGLDKAREEREIN